jgi:RHS repeat-associated protein
LRQSKGSVHQLSFPEQAPDTTQVRCIERDLPGAYMGMTRLLKRQTVYGPIAWQGSLVQDGYDASGLSYRRNRYYDPSTARFTQEDPIGIAGGLNVYGFAGGDPVNYSDPYGLCPEIVAGMGMWCDVYDYNVWANVESCISNCQIRMRAANV